MKYNFLLLLIMIMAMVATAEITVGFLYAAPEVIGAGVVTLILLGFALVKVIKLD